MYGAPTPRPLADSAPAVDLPGTTTVYAFRDPTAAADSLSESRTSEPAPPRTTEGPNPSSTPNPSPADLLKHRWETRWRAAGVEIQSRAERQNPASEPARPAYGAGFESVPLKEARIPRAGPIVPPRPKRIDGTDRADVGQASQPDATDAGQTFEPDAADVGEAFEPDAIDAGEAFEPDVTDVGEAFEPDVRLQNLTYGEHSSAMPLSPPDRPASTPEVPLIELPPVVPAHDAPEPRDAPASFWDQWAPTEEIIDSLRQESPPSDDGDRLTEPPVEFDFPGPQSPLAAEITSEERRGDPPPVETPRADTLAEKEPPGDQCFAGTTTAQTAAAPLEASAHGGIPPSPHAREEGKPVGRSPVQPREPQTIRTIPTARPNASPAHGGTYSAGSHQTRDGLLYAAPVVGKREAVPRGEDHTSEGLYTDSDHRQWPSAKEILAAHQAGQRCRTQPAVRKQARSGELPTVAREPGQWLSPAWLTGPPIALLVLACGTASCVLSLAWAGDSYSASIMTERLLSAKSGGPERPLPDGVAPPNATWVRTTAQHLAHWALYNSRSGERTRTRRRPTSRRSSSKRLGCHPSIRPRGSRSQSLIDEKERR